MLRPILTPATSEFRRQCRLRFADIRFPNPAKHPRTRRFRTAILIADGSPVLSSKFQASILCSSPFMSISSLCWPRGIAILCRNVRSQETRSKLLLLVSEDRLSSKQFVAALRAAIGVSLGREPHGNSRSRSSPDRQRAVFPRLQGILGLPS
jgi:hypothetical protein